MKRIQFIVLTVLFVSLVPTNVHAIHRGIKVTAKSGNNVYLYKDYHALVVGVGDYDYWPDLQGAVKDAKEVAGHFEKAGIKTTLVLNPTSRELRKALNQITYGPGKEKDRAILFFFSGHGETETLATGEKMGYLVPRDCPIPNQDRMGFSETAISMNAIASYALRIQSKHVLMLFDSCFSGSVFSSLKGVPTDISEKSNRPVRQFITAGNENEQVPDDSVFKICLLQGIEGDADLNDDGYVTGSELGLYLDSSVVNYTRGGQHPQYGKIRHPKLDKGDFVFALKIPSKAPSPDVSNSDNVRDYNKAVEHSMGTDSSGTKVIYDISKQKSGQLSVEVEPPEARVRILNIKPKFHQGMNLRPGRYHVEVSNEGYETKKKWIRLEGGENKRLDINLQQLQASNQPTPTYTHPLFTSSLLQRDEVSVLQRVGVYVAYANGIVGDTKTGLEWKVGPDEDTNWDEAKSWVESLNLDGEGWRMPTIDELEGLYSKGMGKRNMTPSLRTTGWWVWSGESKSSSTAWNFTFSIGYRDWTIRHASDGGRAFAVRSRKESRSREIEVASLSEKADHPRPSSTSHEVERDGAYVAYANGIVKDTRTGLDWVAGPNHNMDWNQAKSWVQRLHLDGGGWRMPTTDELETLYDERIHLQNMTAISWIKGWWVWSGDTKGSLEAMAFPFFFLANRVWEKRFKVNDLRALAVRSRRDG